MSRGLAIPDAESVTVEQAAKLAAQIERWADATDDIAELQDARAKVEAIELYMRRRHEGAASEIGRAARKLGLRVGQLLGPPPGRGNINEESHAWDSVPKNDRHRLRKIAAHAHEPAVADAIERGTSQAEVLRATQQATADAKRNAIEAELAEGKAEAKRINERFADRVGDPVENRDASRQRGELSRLCNDLAALPAARAFIKRHRKYLTEEHIERARQARQWLDALITQWEAQP